ncbi:hypothetical protein K501DRAFT_328127 [Backusella circina FSU 941]|nr:hypothetical protein K501DRAFT_328127 [Backusella circina FSU 941]
MEHQFIQVNKKRRIGKVAKPEDANKEDWPVSLRDYVANAFALCDPEKRTLLGAQLTTVVGQANGNGMMDTIDWDKRDLPSACQTTQNPKADIGLATSFTKTLRTAPSSATTSRNTTVPILPTRNTTTPTLPIANAAIPAPSTLPTRPMLTPTTANRIIINPTTTKPTRTLANATTSIRTMVNPSTANRIVVNPTAGTTTRMIATPSTSTSSSSTSSSSTRSSTLNPSTSTRGTSIPNTPIPSTSTASTTTTSSIWSNRLNISSNKLETKKVKPSSIHEVKLTSEELRKRNERAKRFNTDIPMLPTAKKPRSNYTPITWDREPEEDIDTVIVGTSTALEKPYFRLTSAADPATVRPLPVLKKTFKHLSRQWRKEGNYSYICEQFKSMRQDLTVQRIKNEFTVRVYEAHARIALEKGDIGEYNQCQTQLKYLYQLNIEGCNDEFLAYRILYMLFSQNQTDINSMLEEMCNVKLEDHPPCVQHALMVRSSLAKKNYYKFFELYEDAPNMGGYLMDQFVGRERVDALIIACKAYKQGISLSYLAKELSFDDIPQLVKFLREHGVTQVVGRENNGTLNTKSALPILISQSKNYNKVDIKGQI